jgi:hypothetical protein
MRYDHGYPVDANQQCIATTRAGRRCKNKALMQGEVRLSDGTIAIVTEPKCALHGGQAETASTSVTEALNAAAEKLRRSQSRK